MKFIAEIDVMPLKALLDPQGKAVTHGLQNMGYATMENVRVGKHISLEIDADSREAANQQVEEACKNCWRIRSWRVFISSSTRRSDKRHAAEIAVTYFRRTKF